MIEPNIIFENDCLMVLDKPSGWIVNEATTTKGQSVIQNWLLSFKYPIAKSREYRSGIVHRLDKETSGILIVAKTKTAFEALQKQFKDRIIEKVYLTLVHGRVEPKEGTIKSTLGRLPWRRDRFGVVLGGRESQTSYKVAGYYKHENEFFTLLDVYPKTGRTHQIRIHFKQINHPVVSDSFYAGRKTSRNDRKFCPRLFLHAKRIRFNNPCGGEILKIESDSPDDLTKVLDCLEKLQ